MKKSRIVPDPIMFFVRLDDADQTVASDDAFQIELSKTVSANTKKRHMVFANEFDGKNRMRIRAALCVWPGKSGAESYE